MSVRLHLDYAYIMYDKSGNVIFESKLERAQYKACLAIAGAIQGTNRESIYAELSLESLLGRRWYRKLLFFLQNTIWPFSSLPDSLYKFSQII